MEDRYAELIEGGMPVVAAGVLAGAVVGLLFILVRRSGRRTALFNGGFYLVFSCAFLGVYCYYLTRHVESLAAEDRELALCMRLQTEAVEVQGRILTARFSSGRHGGRWFLFTWEAACAAGHLHRSPDEEMVSARPEAKVEDYGTQVAVRYLASDHSTARTVWHIRSEVTRPRLTHEERLHQILVVAGVVDAAWLFVFTVLFFPMSTAPEGRRRRRAAAAASR